MKKTIIYIAMALGVVACSDSNNAALESLSGKTAAISETVDSMSTTKMQKSYDGTWFRSYRDFDGGVYDEFQDYYLGGSHFAFAQNVSGAGNCPGGFQRIDAHRPVDGYNYHYMKVQCYKPKNGPSCLPYPKIKYYTNYAVNNLNTLTARVEATVPPTHEGIGWPHGNSTASFEDSQFNLAFDIYFDKPGQTQANYCALMIWLTYEGTYGPAYRTDQLWREATIDGVDYYVVGRTDWAGCQYQVNYVRKNKSANISNVNILAIINHLKANKYMGCDLSGSNLSNINLGFEIFNAKGALQNQQFTVDKYTLFLN